MDKNIRAKIEALQAEYRRVHSLNTGLIRGHTDTSALTAEIDRLYREAGYVKDVDDPALSPPLVEEREAE